MRLVPVFLLFLAAFPLAWLILPQPANAEALYPAPSEGGNYQQPTGPISPAPNSSYNPGFNTPIAPPPCAASVCWYMNATPSPTGINVQVGLHGTIGSESRARMQMDREQAAHQRRMELHAKEVDLRKQIAEAAKAGNRELLVSLTTSLAGLLQTSPQALLAQFRETLFAVETLPTSARATLHQVSLP
jgi:hypothetical protein